MPGKIYSAIYGTGYGKGYPFEELVDFDESRIVPVGVPEDIKDKDGFLIIWGGEDIHPNIYNMPNIASGVGPRLSKRDVLEIALFNRARTLGMPVLGICRGAQLVCALSGGKLIQDVNSHGRTHLIETVSGAKISTSSVHHQMMYPFDTDHELIAWAAPNRSDIYVGISLNEIEKMGDKEPEIVYFPKTKSLAVQGHPEFMDYNCPFNIYVRGLIKEYGLI